MAICAGGYLVTVIFGTFLGRLDQTVVNLALPKIIGDFSISVTDAAWISTAYILANAVFVPVWGKLGDTAGRKSIYLIGFIGFIVASGLCAVAWNLSSMIVFRIIQGFAVSGGLSDGHGDHRDHVHGHEGARTGAWYLVRGVRRGICLAIRN